MSDIRAPDKEKIRAEYETGKCTFKQLAEKFNISEGTIKSWAKRDKDNGQPWIKNNSKKVATKTKKVATKNKVKKIEKEESKFEEVEEIINSELTDKQRLFCIYYIRNFNATQAYLKAYQCSYDVANVEGYKNLVKPSIKEEIDKLKELKKKSIMLTEDDIVERHMRIAFADMTDFVSFGRKEIEVARDNDDKPIMAEINYIDFKNSYEVDGGLISEIKSSKQGIGIKLEDRQKSLEWLANFFEMNPMNRHKKDYDNARLVIERERIKLDNKKLGADEENNNKLDNLTEAIRKSAELFRGDE
jgi:phage terminase small subunit